MKKIIYYFIQDKENRAYEIHGENIDITVLKGEFSYWFHGGRIHGRRCHTIYIDGCFNTKKYEDYIYLLKQCCTLRGGEGIIFI